MCGAARFFCRPVVRPASRPARHLVSSCVPFLSSRLFVPPSCRWTGSLSPWRFAFRRSCREAGRRRRLVVLSVSRRAMRGVPSSSRSSSRVACLGRCDARGGGVFLWACSWECQCVMWLVGAIWRAGRGVCCIVEASDVVAFRLPRLRLPVPRAVLISSSLVLSDGVCDEMGRGR